MKHGQNDGNIFYTNSPFCHRRLVMFNTKMNKKIILLIFLSLFFFSCDKCECCNEVLSSGKIVYDSFYKSGKLENFNEWGCEGCKLFCSRECYKGYVYGIGDTRCQHK